MALRASLPPEELAADTDGVMSWTTRVQADVEDEILFEMRPFLEDPAKLSK